MKQSVFLFLSVMRFGGQERAVSRLSEMLCDQYDVYIVLFDGSMIKYPISGTILDMHQELQPSPSLIKRVKNMFIRCRYLRSFLVWGQI